MNSIVSPSADTSLGFKLYRLRTNLLSVIWESTGTGGIFLLKQALLNATSGLSFFAEKEFLLALFQFLYILLFAL